MFAATDVWHFFTEAMGAEPLSLEEYATPGSFVTACCTIGHGSVFGRMLA